MLACGTGRSGVTSMVRTTFQRGGDVVGFILIELVILMFAEVPVYVKFEDEGKEKAN